MSTTILIACSEHLSALQKGDLSDATAFSGNDTLAALDVIKCQRPSVIALEDLYAASSRGRALIARVESDPALQECQVRIVAHLGESPAPLPMTGTRRAPRFRVVDGLDVRVDGRCASLVDLSVIGAQVISATTLRPNQRAKFTFTDTDRTTTPMHCVVAWVSMELVSGTSRYRAGVEFSDPDTTAVQRFIDVKRAATITSPR